MILLSGSAVGFIDAAGKVEQIGAPVCFACPCFEAFSFMSRRHLVLRKIARTCGGLWGCDLRSIRHVASIPGRRPDLSHAFEEYQVLAFILERAKMLLKSKTALTGNILEMRQGRFVISRIHPRIFVAPWNNSPSNGVSGNSVRRRTCAGITRRPPTTPENPRERSSVYDRCSGGVG